jgi:hypothetical protein
MLNRRGFLKVSGATAASAYASGLALGDSQTPAIDREPLATVPYGNVELHDGPLKRQFDENHRFFLELDDDRLLKVFRQKAGMPAPGEDMGGWYDIADFDPAMSPWIGFVPGHSFGQYVSALARAYAVTGDEATRGKVLRLVKNYGATVDDKASFFIDYRLPAYTYDKLSCGLIDAHEYVRGPRAMTIHEKLTRGVLAYLPEKALSRAEQRARPHKSESYTWDESYTLPENLFLAYRRSGDSFYRETAIRFLEDDTYFNPLAMNINVLAGEHAYSHMNAFSSAMQAYFITGSEKHLRAARNGFRMVTEQSFATGGWGPNEGFVEVNKGQIGDSLKQTHASFETPCGAYGHFKAARYLLSAERDAFYGDSMERVLYNTVLGAKPILRDGSSFYYSDYGTTGKKTYHRDKWPCCSGTLPQIAADYHISIYLRSRDGMYVNLFVPSSVQWTAGSARCKLTQETQYPFAETVVMHFSSPVPVEQTLYVRIPKWAERAVVAVNGKRISEAEPGSFTAIKRTWKDGDRIELELPMSMRLETVDRQHPNLVALVRGPLVLFAISDSQASFERNALLNAGRVSGTDFDWAATNRLGKPVVLRPFMNIADESYSTYNLLS